MKIAKYLQFRTYNNKLQKWLKNHVLTIFEDKKIKSGLIAPKEATSADHTSVTDRQMAVQRDNVISITLHQV